MTTPTPPPNTPTARAISFADERAIRDHYQRMLDSWEHGPEAYAECFTPDATYIIANGKVQRGWQEIIDGHQIIFSAWARNSRLEGRIDSVTFLTPDVAQLVAYGHIVYKDHRSSDQNKRTVYTTTARRDPDGWVFVSYQNTPLTTH